MKRFIQLVFVLVLLPTLSSQAQSHRVMSKLSVESWDRTNFQLVIDDQAYESRNGLFTATRLPAGNHHIAIVRAMGRRGILQEVYRGQIFIPHSTHVFAQLNRYNRLVVVEKQPITDSYADRSRRSENYYDRGPRFALVNVAAVVQAMNRTSFDDDRLTIAKQSLNNSEIYAAGVERIMRQLSFESSRLEFAQYAYSHCIDPENYYRVNSAFAFSSSINKLDEYVNSYRVSGGGNYRPGQR